MSSLFQAGVLREWGNDATRIYTVYDATGAQTSQRPYTAAENTSADAALTEAAQLTDLTARMAKVEAFLWPPPPAPTVTTGVPTWASLGGVWPNGGLLLDGGTVYRNVSGVPLTTPPSQFPGGPGQWVNLFVVALAGPPPTGAWSGAGVAYRVGDQVTYLTHTYKCIQAHTSQAGWDPVTVPSLWQLVS